MRRSEMRFSMGEPDAELSVGAQRRLALLLVLCGLIGLAASGVLLIERFRLAIDPSRTPSCSINPVLSCGSIMESDQASLLGFPNPIIGVAAFPVLLCTGAALLAGARMRRWFWVGMQAGVTAGGGLVAWLIAQSLYRIGALCPYCMVVWLVVVIVLVEVTLHNATSGHLGRGLSASPVVRGLARWHVMIVMGIVAAVVALILERFWYFWVTLT